MKSLVEAVAERLSIGEEAAAPLVATVVMALRERLPAIVACHLDMALREGSGAVGDVQRMGRALGQAFVDRDATDGADGWRVPADAAWPAR